MVRGSLRQSAEQAQDLMWHLRGGLLEDAEGTVAAESYIADARPSFVDAATPLPDGQYTLLAIIESDSEVALTFATTSKVTTGGGLFTAEASGTTCYTLRLPRDQAVLTTSAADCADKLGTPLADLVADVSIVSFDTLNVRASVTAADYFIPCQCSSGGDCDCPGG